MLVQNSADAFSSFRVVNLAGSEEARDAGSSPSDDLKSKIPGRRQTTLHVTDQFASMQSRRNP
jgi:hypothetical protein